ncbi:hypothetical protein K1719_044133 [Acacia pycnantha]|nr:hypothetical protein K1719_044133 [Acacia pycnantha]
MDSTEHTYQHRPFSIKFWPPSQSTRLLLVERMTKNLTTPSIFSRKYGLLSREEAEEDAKKIEETVFTTANQHFEKEPDGDGSSAVQIYAKESSKLMLEVLKRGPRVKEDGESINEQVNVTTETVYVVFGSLLSSQTYLEELYLVNDGVSEEAAKAVSELLPSTEKLRVLYFHNNMTGDAGATAIADILKHSPAMENFRCSSTIVGSDGGVALAEALGTCTHLKKLDLRDNMFGVEAGVALSKVIPAFADLTEIYLNYLNLEDEGAEAIAIALKESAPSLEVQFESV